MTKESIPNDRNSIPVYVDELGKGAPTQEGLASYIPSSRLRQTRTRRPLGDCDDLIGRVLEAAEIN